MKVKVTQLCPTLCDPMDYSPWNFPGQNTGVGSLSLLQGIFPTQGLNPSLPNYRQILYQLSYKGSPRILEWVAYPFSRESSWPRNQAGVSCIAGRFFTNWAIKETQSQEPKSHLILCHILLQQRIEISNMHTHTHTHTHRNGDGEEEKTNHVSDFPCRNIPPACMTLTVNTCSWQQWALPKSQHPQVQWHMGIWKGKCSLHEAYNLNFLF